MRERVVLFGERETLVGVIAEPTLAEQNRRLPAVILLNAGLIHRIGPHRLYVKIARALANIGFVVLRFDFSGTGDSQAREDHLPFEQSGVDEAQEAMTYLTKATGVERFLLMGHCSGAGFSFVTACKDPRVTAAVLMNPQGGNEEWTAYDRSRKLAQYYANYYGKAALFDPQRWLKLLAGKSDYRSIARNVFQIMIWNRISALIFRFKKVSLGHRDLLQSTGQTIRLDRDLRLLAERDVRLLFVYSEGNSGLDYIRAAFGSELDRLLAANKLTLEVIPQSDHLFTLLDSQQRVLEVLQGWIRAVAA
jgi:pimeloyl-ACP methyl ester carboxylesterase